MRSNEEFVGLKRLGDLAKKMVEMKKDKVYPLVDLLITLALVLHVKLDLFHFHVTFIILINERVLVPILFIYVFRHLNDDLKI